MSSHSLAPLGGGAPLLRSQEIARLIGISRVSLHKMIARGDFPRGIVIGSRIRAWPAPQVRDWLAAREAAAR